MTERTIRSLAKKLAGIFYEQAGGDLFGSAPHDRERSKRFRQTYPTLKDFMRGIQHKPDGSKNIDKPGWLFFVDAARKRMANMLADPSVHQNVKDGILAALLEEHQKSTSPQAVELLQRRMGEEISIAGGAR